MGDLRYASSLPVPRSFAHYAHNNDARTYNDDASDSASVRNRSRSRSPVLIEGFARLSLVSDPRGHCKINAILGSIPFCNASQTSSRLRYLTSPEGGNWSSLPASLSTKRHLIPSGGPL